MSRILRSMLAIGMAVILLIGTTLAEDALKPDPFEQIPSELLVSKQIGYSITTKPTVIENERFAVNIPQNAYVPDTLEADIHRVMDTIEQQTGLSYYSDYAKEHGHSKVMINISKYPDAEFGSSSGGAYGVDLCTGDLISSLVMDLALTHELLHTVHWRNTLWGSMVLYEAFTTYEVQQIVEAQVYPISFDAYSNYADSDFDNIAIIKSVKAQFEICDEDAWQAYLLGFRFMHYFVEKYGLEEFYALGRDGKEGFLSDMEAYDILLERYGEEIFTDYAAWLKENGNMFRTVDSVVDFSAFKRLEAFPFKGAFNLYSICPFRYQDYIIFDFLSGFDYAKNYLNAECKGCISGKVCSDGTAHMRFYDADGNTIQTIKLEPYAWTDYSVEGATLVAFAGDGKMIRFFPDIESMMTIP